MVGADQVAQQISLDRTREDQLEPEYVSAEYDDEAFHEAMRSSAYATDEDE